jgi:simple sugar transport system ATP-binding protein
MALSDRIAVMFRGKIMDIVPTATATREQLGLLMLGMSPEEIKSRSTDQTDPARLAHVS